MLLEHAEQFAGTSRCKCRWMEPWVVEEVFIAGDDCSGACCRRERDEVVVVGIAKNRWRISRIAQADAVVGQEADDPLGFFRRHAVTEVATGKAASDLLEKQGADDCDETPAVESAEEEAGRSLRVTGDAGQHRAGVDDQADQRSRRASCTASTPTAMASSSERLKRSWRRRMVA